MSTALPDIITRASTAEAREALTLYVRERAGYRGDFEVQIERYPWESQVAIRLRMLGWQSEEVLSDFALASASNPLVLVGEKLCEMVRKILAERGAPGEFEAMAAVAQANREPPLVWPPTIEDQTAAAPLAPDALLGPRKYPGWDGPHKDGEDPDTLVYYEKDPHEIEEERVWLEEGPVSAYPRVAVLASARCKVRGSASEEGDRFVIVARQEWRDRKTGLVSLYLGHESYRDFPEDAAETPPGTPGSFVLVAGVVFDAHKVANDILTKFVRWLENDRQERWGPPYVAPFLYVMQADYGASDEELLVQMDAWAAENEYDDEEGEFADDEPYPNG